MKDGTWEMVFNGPSPDEITLVDFAWNNGLLIHATSDNEYIVKVLPESGLIQKEANYAENHKGDDDEPPNENSMSAEGLAENQYDNQKVGQGEADLSDLLVFQVHKIMEFNSDRKWMSIVLTDPTDGLTKVYMKGADSIIKERLSEESKNDQWMMPKINQFLKESSTKGFRTLLMAMWVID